MKKQPQFLKNSKIVKCEYLRHIHFKNDTKTKGGNPFLPFLHYLQVLTKSLQGSG
jgi:hypothetical protein